MSMAIPTVNSWRLLSADQIPVVDLRSLSQSDLNSLSLCSNNAFDPRRSDDLVTPKIDRLLFNESAGSRKQTYSRLRLSSRSSVSSPVADQRRRLLPERTTSSSSDSATDVEKMENKRIIQCLCDLLNRHQSGSPNSIAEQKIETKVSEAKPVAATSTAIVVYNREIETRNNTGSVGLFNRNGIVVDLEGLANTENLFADELYRRTRGLVTEAQLLDFLQGLNGTWGSRRKKRKIVDADEFGDDLPSGWKILLGLRRKEGHVWLYCRRFISPNGRQFTSCKEVVSFLHSLARSPDETKFVSGHDVENRHCTPQVNEGTAELPEEDNVSREVPVCYAAVPISSVTASPSQQVVLLRVENPAKAQLRNLLECRKCSLSFGDKDSYVQHLLSVHHRSAKRTRLGKSVGDGVILNDGKYECQFCHKIFEERRRYNGHVGIHVRNYVKSLEEIPDEIIVQTSIDSSALTVVPPLAARQIVATSQPASASSDKELAFPELSEAKCSEIVHKETLCLDPKEVVYQQCSSVEAISETSASKSTQAESENIVAGFSSSSTGGCQSNAPNEESCHDMATGEEIKDHQHVDEGNKEHKHEMTVDDASSKHQYEMAAGEANSEHQLEMAIGETSGEHQHEMVMGEASSENQHEIAACGASREHQHEMAAFAANSKHLHEVAAGDASSEHVREMSEGEANSEHLNEMAVVEESNEQQHEMDAGEAKNEHQPEMAVSEANKELQYEMAAGEANRDLMHELAMDEADDEQQHEMAEGDTTSKQQHEMVAGEVNSKQHHEMSADEANRKQQDEMAEDIPNEESNHEMVEADPNVESCPVGEEPTIYADVASGPLDASPGSSLENLPVVDQETDVRENDEELINSMDVDIDQEFSDATQSQTDEDSEDNVDNELEKMSVINGNWVDQGTRQTLNMATFFPSNDENILGTSSLENESQIIRLGLEENPETNETQHCGFETWEDKLHLKNSMLAMSEEFRHKIEESSRSCSMTLYDREQIGFQAEICTDNISDEKMERVDLEEIGGFDGPMGLDLGISFYGSNSEVTFSGHRNEENLLKSLMDESAIQSSDCFVSNQGEDAFGNGNQKLESMSGFEELRFEDLGLAKFSYSSSERSSALPEPTLVLACGSELENPLDTSVHFEWETDLSKMVGSHQLTVVCVWCRAEFSQEGINVDAQSDSVGFMCPSCKARISGQFNIFEHSLSL